MKPGAVGKRAAAEARKVLLHRLPAFAPVSAEKPRVRPAVIARGILPHVQRGGQSAVIHAIHLGKLVHAPIVFLKGASDSDQFSFVKSDLHTSSSKRQRAP